MMPPAALARLRELRAAMPEPVVVRPSREWLDASQTVAVVRVRRSEQPARTVGQPESERKAVARERVKRRCWPAPGEVEQIFREEQRRHR